jgi:hypothetical protein
LVDFIGVKSDEIFNPRESRKFGFRYPSKREVHRAKPDLFDVSLVSVVRDDLLDGELLAALDVFAQPDKTESTPTQELYLFKSVRKSVAKSFNLLICESVVVRGKGLL